MTASDEDIVDLDMNALDALFAQATNDVGTQPSEAFMTRVVTDALAQQPMPQFAPPSLPDLIFFGLGLDLFRLGLDFLRLGLGLDLVPPGRGLDRVGLGLDFLGLGLDLCQTWTWLFQT